MITISPSPAMSIVSLLLPFFVEKLSGRTGSWIFSFSALYVSHIWYLILIRQLSLLVNFVLDNLHQNRLEVFRENFKDCRLVRPAVHLDCPAARYLKQYALHLFRCVPPALTVAAVRNNL